MGSREAGAPAAGGTGHVWQDVIGLRGAEPLLPLR